MAPGCLLHKILQNFFKNFSSRVSWEISSDNPQGDSLENPSGILSRTPAIIYFAASGRTIEKILRRMFETSSAEFSEEISGRILVGIHEKIV